MSSGNQEISFLDALEEERGHGVAAARAATSANSPPSPIFIGGENWTSAEKEISWLPDVHHKNLLNIIVRLNRELFLLG